jgi:aspartate/methionine/tyrosine aminotransferase
MDIIRIPRSRILEIARIALATPDVDLLCFGESDQPSPASAHAAAIAALTAGATRYPDVRGLAELRTALARYLSSLHAKPVVEARIQITGSGMAAVSIALMATVRAGDRVVLHSPAWPNVGNAARLRGAEVNELPLTARPDGGFEMDFDRLDTMLRGARAFILNSPNNPTGWTATGGQLAVILEIARRRKVWLISDEVYSRLVYDGAQAAPSLLDIAEPNDRLFVCNSFSKTWVMTGWRLGWLVVPEGARSAVTELVEVTHSGVAPFVQHAGLAAVHDVDAVEQFRAHCTRGRKLVGDALAELNGVRYVPPAGAFYAFVGLEGLTDSLRLAEKLVVDHHVAVAPGIAFGAAGEAHVEHRESASI